MKRIIIVFVVCLTASLVNAQTLERDVISNAGGYLKTSNMALEYTIGEVVVSEFKTSSIRLGQGFNQVSFDTLASVGLLSKSNIIVFPNPGTESISVQSETDVSVSMYDLTGKLVMNTQHVTGGEISGITVHHLSSGVYMIHLKDKADRVSTLRWVKQ